MHILNETVFPEPVMHLPSGIDFRTQGQRDAWQQREYDAAVAANEKRRREAEDDEPDYDDSTYHQHDGTFAEND